MKQFDYNNYLKNNPLLKEGMQTYYKDKQSGEVVSADEMLDMVDPEDALDSFSEIGNFNSKEEAEAASVQSYLAAAGFTKQDYALDGVLLTLTNSGRQKLRRQTAYDLMQMGITINESKKENVNEITKKQVFRSVVELVKKAVSQGNTSDIKALQQMIEDELDLNTSFGFIWDDEEYPDIFHMQYLLVGAPANTDCVINLANKPKYRKSLDAETDVNYTKIGNWYIREW